MLKKFYPILLLLSAHQAAYGAHPLITDDTGTQGTGNNQIEITTDSLRQAGETLYSGAFTYSYGVNENLDAIVNLPGSFSSPTGFNDVSVGVKWRFFERGNASIAVKPEILLPTGDARQGLGNGRTSAAMTMVGSYDAAPWAYHANVGLAMNRYSLQTDRDANRRSVWRASLAVTYALNERWLLAVDSGIEQDIDRTSIDHPAFLLVGVIYSPVKNLDLDAGIKTTVSCGQCPNGRERQLSTGLTWRF